MMLVLARTIRGHFVLDIGAGYELDINKTWSVASPLIGIALMAAFWSAILLY